MRPVWEQVYQDRARRHRDTAGSLEVARDTVDSLAVVALALQVLRKQGSPEVVLEPPDRVGKQGQVRQLVVVPVLAPQPGSSGSLPVSRQSAADT